MAACRDRILVVDDDQGLRELLVRYLTDNGYEAAGVSDGAAMKRHLAVHPVDLLLLDVMLPGEDGLSLARALSAQGAQWISPLLTYWAPAGSPGPRRGSISATRP